MPDLVARLSGLHTTITTRLSLQESLLSLSGRLDMVLSQIEMRSSVAPAPLAPRGAGKRTLDESENATRYVEGESEEEEEKMEIEVEKNSGDEAGSVEDVELGGESSGEESEEGEEDSDSSGSDGEEPTVNGFIDDEADEYTDEDESGEEVEDEDEDDSE